MGKRITKVKESVANATQTTKRVATNGEQFVQAVALLIVAGFSYYALQQLEVGEYSELTVTVALVVIGLRGFVELFRFLDK